MGNEHRRIVVWHRKLRSLGILELIVEYDITDIEV